MKKPYSLNKLLPLVAFSILLLVPVGAQNAFAVTVIDANDIAEPSKTVDFSQFGPFVDTQGPVQVGDLVGEDIEWSSTTPFSVIGNGFYGLGTNGNWDAGRNGYVGLNDADQGNSMRFDFNDDSVCGVGGFVNYAPDFFQNPFTITALDSNNDVLETFDVSNNAPISTPNAINDGEFRGIVRATNDIAALELSGEFDVLDDLKFTRCEVVVGGEFLSIDSTALLLAGLQTSAIWMLPVLAGVAGSAFGVLYIKHKRN